VRYPRYFYFLGLSFLSLSSHFFFSRNPIRYITPPFRKRLIRESFEKRKKIVVNCWVKFTTFGVFRFPNKRTISLGLSAANVLGGPGLYRYTIGALRVFFRYSIVCKNVLYRFITAYLFPIRANFCNKTLFSALILLFLYNRFFLFVYIFGATFLIVLKV